jgi:Zn-dependent protease with chaperone function
MAERARRRTRGWLLGAGAALALLVGASVARAQTIDELSRAKEERFRAELRAESAEAASIFERAETAYDVGNYDEAEVLYGRVIELAPAFRVAKRRRALALASTKRHAEALALARSTLRSDDADENIGAFVLVVARNPESTKAELAEAMAYAVSVVERRPDDPWAQKTLCIVALSAQRLPELDACSRALMRQWPTSSEGYVFGTLASATHGEWGQAHERLAKAKASGMPPEAHAALERDLDAHESFLSAWGRRLLPLLALWAGTLGLLVVAGMALSRAALRAAGRVPREPTGRAQGADALLRGVYRAVLLASGVFYYASLPLVAGAVVVAAGAVIVAIMALGVVPIKLVAVAAIVAFVTLYAFAKSVLTRASEGEPGLPLDLAAQPRLRAALDEVAERVGTRPVDAVYLTPAANVAVFERGGLGRQLAGKAERCLVLGVGVLEGLGLSPFKAILAHEYGHFSNRDTAGGGLALAVRRSLLHAAIGLARGGAAGWYNPAWWFVSGYYRVFLRISHGASRLQEVLADRWAAFTYGPETFAEGLTHVVRRSIAFDAHSEATLREVIEAKTPLANLYRHRPKEAPEPADLEARVREEIECEPSPFDSHPSPAERIAWVRTLKAPPNVPEEGAAWELFGDRDAIERALTERVRQNIERAHGVVIPAAAGEESDAEAAAAAGEEGKAEAATADAATNAAPTSA